MFFFHCLHTISLSCTCSSNTFNRWCSSISTIENTSHRLYQRWQRNYWMVLFDTSFYSIFVYVNRGHKYRRLYHWQVEHIFDRCSVIFVQYLDPLTVVYCHRSSTPGIMTIRCQPNEKIRMLDAFDAAVNNRSQLPRECSNANEHYQHSYERVNSSSCRIHTSFTSACSGRENCTLHMQRIRLNSQRDNCHNVLVDYTMAFFECISGRHDQTTHNELAFDAIFSCLLFCDVSK
jgi:hypothetical protein